jgi:carbon monoxide dehydrogenase subunit G
MIKYESSVTIDRPHAEVAAYVIDPDRHREWMDDVASVEHLTPGDVRIGSRYRYGFRKGPIAFDLKFQVSALDSNGSVTFTSEPGGRIHRAARIEVEPIDPSRTRVTSSGEMSLRGVWRLLEPLMSGEIRSSEAAELIALKRVLEAGPSPEAVAARSASA